MNFRIRGLAAEQFSHLFGLSDAELARAFDDKAMMTGWELIEGIWLEKAIERQFADPAAQYLHIHFAAPGCYAARVERA
jgi:hypothetical protein